MISLLPPAGSLLFSHFSSVTCLDVISFSFFFIGSGRWAVSNKKKRNRERKYRQPYFFFLFFSHSTKLHIQVTVGHIKGALAFCPRLRVARLAFRGEAVLQQKMSSAEVSLPNSRFPPSARLLHTSQSHPSLLTRRRLSFITLGSLFFLLPPFGQGWTDTRLCAFRCRAGNSCLPLLPSEAQSGGG